MSKQIIIGEQHRIAAVFSDDHIQELIVASGHHQVGDVYLGIVENVLPSIDAAFINIGNPERNGFIHVSDLGPIRLKRNSSAITELVTPQQKVLVQVMKEPTGNKGPRLTGNLSFPGRYLVMLPFGRGVNLSSRIRNDEERNRLKSLAILIKPPQMGLMVRTEAEGMPEESIIEDLEILKAQWETIQQEQHSTRAPNLLNRDNDFIQKVLRDAFSDHVNRIVTDSNEGVQRVRKHLQGWNKGRMPSGVAVDSHREPTHIFEYYRVNAAIRQALRPRVDLPSGGYIIIEPTEALTVVDVNSGSFTRSATSRETVLWTNCEAATEIAHQLRLRNIAGVIVVDFIDMDSRRDQLQVLEHFNKALRADKARPQVAQLSELGLVELTRKRQGQSLYEVFGRPCPTCDGLGLLAHLPGEHSGADAETPEASSVMTGYDSEMDGRRGGDRNGSRRRGRYGSSRTTASSVPESLYQGNRRRRGGPVLPEREEADRSETAPRAEFARSESPRRVIADPSRTGPFTEAPETPSPSSSSPPPPVPSTTPRRARRQTIAVEMTPLQQQVYSEMGISPLALLDEPVKLTRDTTVAVTLPGQPVVTTDNTDLGNGDDSSGDESNTGEAYVSEETDVAVEEFGTTPVITESAGDDEFASSPPETPATNVLDLTQIPPFDPFGSSEPESSSPEVVTESDSGESSEEGVELELEPVLEVAEDAAKPEEEEAPAVKLRQQSPAASRRRRRRTTE